MARELTGVVTSDKADKTITVTVTSRETHPLYKKQYSISRKYTAHDPKNQAHQGDTVLISEIRPVSKTKSWQLVKMVEEAKGRVELRDELAEVEAIEEAKKEAEEAKKAAEKAKEAKATKKSEKEES